MKRGAASASVLAALLLAAAALLPAAPSAARAEDPPAAAPANPVAEAQKLADEAVEFEKVAGDGDADSADRKTARKAAFDRLKKARALLDAWLDAHPEDLERLDRMYSEIAGRFYWIKKMSSIDELGPERPATGPADPAPGATPPGAKEPAKPPAPPTPAQAIEEIEGYGKKHPGDVPGLYERYQEFLSKYPDPAATEYATAMGRVDELGKRLKDVYRLVHDDDPDSVKNVDSAQTEKLLGQLLEDLEKGAPEVRERAARFLGALGSGKAADPLIKALKREKSGPVYAAASDALARIGGRRVCERLLKAGRDDDLATTVVHILQTILERGGAEGRVAGEALGGYADALVPEARGPIFAALSNAGSVGALGLARGLPYAPPEDVEALVSKLPEAGDPRVVQYVAKLCIVNAQGLREDHARAARNAIKKIGKPGVRYLIPNLDDASVAVWTAELLHQITGQKLKDDKRKTWETWFRANRKSLEGK